VHLDISLAFSFIKKHLTSLCFLPSYDKAAAQQAILTKMALKYYLFCLKFYLFERTCKCIGMCHCHSLWV